MLGFSLCSVNQTNCVNIWMKDVYPKRFMSVRYHLDDSIAFSFTQHLLLLHLITKDNPEYAHIHEDCSCCT